MLIGSLFRRPWSLGSVHCAGTNEASIRNNQLLEKASLLGPRRAERTSTPSAQCHLSCSSLLVPVCTARGTAFVLPLLESKEHLCALGLAANKHRFSQAP